MSDHRYQFLPPLLPEEYETLKASIAERGVDVPLVMAKDGDNPKGDIIDGFHRKKACDELGITNYPTDVREFEHEWEKFELALRLNCRRRQLNETQKRELIATYLQRDPTINNKHLADNVGVSPVTVGKVRETLEATSQIKKLTSFRGRDGKNRPRKYKKIITNTPNELKTALRIVGDLPDNCEGKTLDITTAKRRAARNRNKNDREEKEQTVEPLGDDDIRLFHCRFQELEQVADIKPTSVNLVLTDIPYGQEFVPQVAELGEFASRVLVEGGLLVTYCGQYWLHKVLAALGENLTYRWTNASVWDGDATPVHIGGWKEPHGRVLSKWKPIVVFSKGGFPKRGQWCDVTHVTAKEKEWHPWQQPLHEVETLVKYFSDKGDLVVDPCAGAFTTAVACLHQNRRFIGCDVEAKCVDIGRQRMAEERSKG